MTDAWEQARAYLEEHCHLPLEIGSVAAEHGFSRYHFIRTFRQRFGTTPYQYLTQQRIERAKALLTYSDLSITGVCHAVGYDSLGSFSTLFQRIVGCPPSRYRQQTQAQYQAFYAAVPACYFHMLGFSQVLEQNRNFQEVLDAANEYPETIDHERRQA